MGKRWPIPKANFGHINTLIEPIIAQSLGPLGEANGIKKMFAGRTVNHFSAFPNVIHLLTYPLCFRNMTSHRPFQSWIQLCADQSKLSENSWKLLKNSHVNQGEEVVSQSWNGIRIQVTENRHSVPFLAKKQSLFAMTFSRFRPYVRTDSYNVVLKN